MYGRFILVVCCLSATKKFATLGHMLSVTNHMLVDTLWFEEGGLVHFLGRFTIM